MSMGPLTKRESKIAIEVAINLSKTDIGGPWPHTSSNNNYHLRFVDVYSKYTWIYFLPKKSDATKTFAEFQLLAQKQLGHTLKVVQSNGGGEFQFLSTYLSQRSVVHRIKCPNTSQQNGIVERTHRHIVELDLTLLAQAFVPLHYWTEAFFSAVFLINWLPSTPLAKCSSHELLFKSKHNYSFLKVFGCL